METPITVRLPRKNTRKDKIINDPIHGHMEFDSELVKIIDTQYFQRLRELKQLGSGDWVFPGAVHNRFIHSLGVCHLADKLIRRLQRKRIDLKISDRDCFLVSLAALCHDMGHGPYSHGFERVVQIVLNIKREKLKNSPEELKGIPKSWHHEQASEVIFVAACHEAELEISEEEIELVKAMIRGVGENEHRPMGKQLFFFQIVSNKQTGMDVDKYDYLMRDAMFTGAKIAFDVSRLLRPEVRKDTNSDNLVLAYYRKEEWMIHQLFRSRFDLHHQVYGHSVVVAFQLMIEEVLVCAKDWLRIYEAITNPKLYLRLTDGVVHRIECLDPKNPPNGFERESLARAQNIINRIKQRDLYTSILQDLVLKDDKDMAYRDKMSVEKSWMKQLLEVEPRLKSRRKDFLIVLGDRDFTRKNENPLFQIPFYSDRGQKAEASRLAECDLQNTTMPAKFWERYARIYIKDKSDTDLVC